MDFPSVIKTVVGRLEKADVRYALIGGFAMALRGVQRATADLDFILMLDDLGQADEILRDLGYQRAFHSENVSHYQAEERAWGRIDILHAFRGPTLGMIARADNVEVMPGLRVKVVQIEDLIGLKIQALVNCPQRALMDWHDIGMMLQMAGERKKKLDWELLKDYLNLFEMAEKIPEMEKIYEGN
jgi:predicted nucleotidyltransferase